MAARMVRATISISVLACLAGCSSDPATLPGDGKPLEHWVERLDSTSTETRLHATRRIGEYGEDAASAGPRLASSLADAEPAVRAMAARSLGLTWDGEDDDSRLTILPALFGAMRDSDPDVAGEAATALGRAGLLALPGLLTALDDREPAMCHRSQAAHGSIPTTAALRRRLPSREHFTRRWTTPTLPSSAGQRSA